MLFTLSFTFGGFWQAATTAWTGRCPKRPRVFITKVKQGKLILSSIGFELREVSLGTVRPMESPVDGPRV